MNFSPLLQRLRQELGLDPQSLGDATLQASMLACMRAAGYDDPQAYARHLQHDARAWQRLIDEVVVSETWFFRGGELFGFLAEQIQLARRERPDRAFRVLSLPCSSGEEAYSLAIAALELGLPPGCLHLDGVDVSRRALLAAGQGLYGALAFRQTPPHLRERYFRKVGSRWEIRPEPRQGSRFLHGNLIASDLLAAEPPYDLIFCRNVFIYLTAEARQAAWDNLARLLRPEGLLCTSVTEAPPRDERRFARWGPQAYGLFRRLGKPPETLTLPKRPRGVPVAVASVPLPACVASVAATTPSPSTPSLTTPSLEEARRLADRGQLDQALAVCQLFETQREPSADLYALVGVIQQSRGQTTLAHEAFRKALYLQADHREALTHLWLLARHSGDQATAKGLQRRLARLRAAPEQDTQAEAEDLP